jgi:signal transduction histidine kinase
MPHALCFAGSSVAGDIRLASGEDRIADCWIVAFRDPGGTSRTLMIGLPHYLGNRQTLTDPIYLALIVLMSASVATVVGLFAIKPLRQLARATEAFSLHDEPALLPEIGPQEIRTAIATFNLMQQRVSEGHRQRTGMLAAISHDLQTPLTRLQLRLDDLADADARARLGADLAIMQAIVREGLELARSAETNEPWSEVDVDSLLGSIAADAAELGAQVEIGKTCGVTMRTKVDALTRCLTNLVENAIKYGGCARIDCHVVPGRLDIHIADEGPGLSAAEIDQVFEPFVRGEQSRSRATGGTGLGLTIARAQAKLLGGEVSLENREGGGLLATVRIAMR